jgi:hypothetical protein
MCKYAVTSLVQEVLCLFQTCGRIPPFLIYSRAANEDNSLERHDNLSKILLPGLILQTDSRIKPTNTFLYQL